MTSPGIERATFKLLGIIPNNGKIRVWSQLVKIGLKSSNAAVFDERDLLISM